MSKLTKEKKYKSGDRRIYENVFDGISYYPTVGEIYHLNRAKMKVQSFYLEAIMGKKSPKILDIGCHIGTDLFMLPKPNPKAMYWGADVSKDAIEYAKKLVVLRGDKKIEFINNDANKPLPFKNGFFDVIMALELIEHLHDPVKFLDEVNRVLKPGGSLIISTPNGERIQNKLVEFLPGNLRKSFVEGRDEDFTRHGKAFHIDSTVWDEDAHISLYGFSKWKGIFKEAGFSIDKVEGSSWFGGSRIIGSYPFLLGTAVLLDALIDKLPLKPRLQMCLIVKLRKNEK